MYNKILGGLVGAAAGDAMGAATEARTREQIIEYFGHEVTDFEIPPMDTFAAGSKAGQVTDDFSSAYFIAKYIVDAGGNITEQVVKNALIEWSKHSMFFDRFAGPTTRLAIYEFEGREVDKSGKSKLATRQATNGSAMRISPIGLMNPGNLDAAINNAAKVTMLTHDNYLAISGACAVAAAVSKAMMDDADVYNVLRAGLYGAAEGEKIGREIARDAAGPSVVKRMEVAIEIGFGKGSSKEKSIDIAEKIGIGLHVSETVPSAFGIFAANNGDAMGTIINCVNAGYDTDTLATIAGAIAGTLRGSQVFPNHFLPILEEVNGFHIKGLAKGIENICHGRQSIC
ncbi:ADP-ribosylglycohydrolase [Tissierella praeacuta]|uniref:ADP-ribosylglycohydrolase family protein n=1 Tax=Tissierella praeacuta TaxID=43131 RepID=UPI00104BAE6D|nr:ADP-ribosylglycohydrolase family protein [Tissierella praeacuta]TCU79288.1 ADP-ribosylglycohydrolase [Tissierella praeacuta]